MRQTGAIDVENGRLWYESMGDGPDVVFLHPGLWDCRAWDAQFDVFADRYRVVRYDLRGYGHSTRPEPGVPYSHVTDLVALLDALAIERTALIGNSMGGRVALETALYAPDRASALVLVAPGLDSGFDATPEEEAWYQEVTERIEAAVAAGDLEGARRVQMEIWAPLGIDDERGRRIFEIGMENVHELTMDESGEVEVLDPPAAARLADVAVPTLVVPADLDPPVMQRINAMLATEVPNARVVHLANVDHVVGMRAPAAFNEAVLDFLAQVL